MIPLGDWYWVKRLWSTAWGEVTKNGGAVLCENDYKHKEIKFSNFLKY